MNFCEQCPTPHRCGTEGCQKPFNGYTGTTTMSYDAGKPDITLIDPQFLRDLSLVLGKGAEKYERDNWRLGTNYQRRTASALRHILAWLDGEDTDPELQTPHLINAVANLMFVHYWQANGLGTDDRFKTNHE